MHVTAADGWRLPAGPVRRWTLRPAAVGEPVVLSVNQRNHLAGVVAGQPSVWLAADLPAGSVPGIEAPTDLLDGLLARHAALRTAVAPGDGTGAVLHAPDGLVWVEDDVVRAGTSSDATSAVRDLLDRACHPLAPGPPVAAALVGAGAAARFVLAGDHLVLDAWSVALLASELGTPRALPAAPAFPALAARWAAEPALPPDDARLHAWLAFLDGLDQALPTFPLDLGTAPGERFPQRTLVVPFLDAATVAALDDLGRPEGASAYAAVLLALGRAVRAQRDEPAATALPLLVPVGTRRTEEERATVGWCTTTVPLVVAATDDLRATGERLRAALALGSVPLDQVLGSLPRPLRRTRADVFMVSWIDYRRLPTVPAGTNHVSNVTEADDVQLWLSRTDAGVAVRARIPDHPPAVAVVTALLERWVAEVALLLR
ncbi:hypothetical protein QE364_003570 [Nocardioides zeae]|uniref:Uncharacterized protein n=1 Tax=Nocardioides zeae TaxID=1457234 RepID=A0ACC6IMD1_9ACTN|nr:hypothetical protein [Nocardioides zeae]MDR6173872.1 hypothetical protein [Nocardioides zeae]MDR6211839.1 hypothetical protein [Nocardioides zeae]